MFILSVLYEIAAECARQDVMWGEQDHPHGTGGTGLQADADAARRDCERHFGEGSGTWLDILQEEVSEAFAESDPIKLRAELIQVAAVAVAWVQAIDRRGVRECDSNVVAMVGDGCDVRSRSDSAVGDLG